MTHKSAHNNYPTDRLSGFMCSSCADCNYTGIIWIHKMWDLDLAFLMVVLVVVVLNEVVVGGGWGGGVIHAGH